jgi:hypothetical protein
MKYRRKLRRFVRQVCGAVGSPAIGPKKRVVASREVCRWSQQTIRFSVLHHLVMRNQGRSQKALIDPESLESKLVRAEKVRVLDQLSR